ncbi:HEAT repeat domain-containing protein, partial [Acinetobacter baumannii]
VRLGSPSVPALVEALGVGDWDVRVAACGALGWIGDATAVPALVQALGDAEDRERVGA